MLLILYLNNFIHVLIIKISYAFNNVKRIVVFIILVKMQNKIMNCNNDS